MLARTQMSSRTTIFVSYSRKDRKFLNEFEAMFTPAIRDGIVDFWDDSRLLPGDMWKDRIQQALANARVALLLVSSNFLASDFIAKYELPRLLSRAQEGGLFVYWVYVGPCLYQQTSIANYQAAHDISRPLSML